MCLAISNADGSSGESNADGDTASGDSNANSVGFADA